MPRLRPGDCRITGEAIPPEAEEPVLGVPEVVGVAVVPGCAGVVPGLMVIDGGAVVVPDGGTVAPVGFDGTAEADAAGLAGEAVGAEDGVVGGVPGAVTGGTCGGVAGAAADVGGDGVVGVALPGLGTLGMPGGLDGTEAAIPGCTGTGELLASPTCAFALSGSSTRLVTPPSDNKT